MRFITVTLNPSLDLYAVPDRPEFGKTNRIRGEYVLPGGKGLNVSRVLHCLGSETEALCFISGFTGQELKRLMEATGVPCTFLDTKNGATRVNLKLLGEVVTEFNRAGNTLSEAHIGLLEKRLKKLSSEDTLILSGSLPEGQDPGLYARLTASCPARCVMDTSGKALSESASARPWLIKPNREELSALTGVSIRTKEDAFEAGRAAQDMGFRNILCSLGEEGAVLLNEEGAFYEASCPPLPGKPVNTVGAGDTLLAAFLHKYTETNDPELSLRFAVTAGSAAVACRDLPDAEDILKLWENVSP